MKEELRPEDFWPGAEKLLDKHYKAKRNRKVILWFIALLSIVGASVYFSSDRSSEKKIISGSKNNISQQLKKQLPEKVVTTGSEKEISSTKTKSDLQSSESTIEKNVPSHTNINDKIVKNQDDLKTESKQITSNNKITSKKSASKAVEAGTVLAANTTQQSADISQPVTSEKEINQNISATEPVLLPDFQNRELFAMNAPVFDGIETDKPNLQTAATRKSNVENPKTKSSAEYRFNVLAGANLITKQISGYDNLSTETKRNEGEKEVVTPQLNIEVSRVTDNFAMSLGLNYIQYGEEVNYDPSVKSKVTINNSYWNTYTTTVIDTDTNYVYGFVYFSQQATQRQDSSYVTQMDTVEQTVVNDNILKSTGTNVISYFEIPFSMSYYFGRNKFRYGVSAGVSAGFLVYSHGYYLNQAGTDVVDLNEEKIFKSVIFNGQVGLDFRYLVSPNLHVLFRPQYRMNLDSIIKDGTGFQQKYSAYGISAGISWLIK